MENIQSNNENSKNLNISSENLSSDINSTDDKTDLREDSLQKELRTHGNSTSTKTSSESDTKLEDAKSLSEQGRSIKNKKELAESKDVNSSKKCDESHESDTGLEESLAEEGKAQKNVDLEEPLVADGILPLGKIPMEISVELGHFFIDAHESNTLSVGDVVKLTSSNPGLVRLVCNDHEVGRGELVDINGQLAVQIVQNWSAE